MNQASLAESAHSQAGVIVLALLTAIWGSNFLFTKLALSQFGALEVASARLLMGAIALTIIVFAMGQGLPTQWRHWVRLVPLGFMNFALPFYLMVYAQVSLPSSTSAMFIAAIPLFTLFFTRLVLKESVSLRRWTGFAIGFAGLIGLTISSQLGPATTAGSAMPQLALILASICFALSSILIRKMPSVAPLPATASMLWLGSLMLLPFGGGALSAQLKQVLATPMAVGEPGFTAVAALLFLAILPTAVGQAMRTFTIQRHGPVFFSIVGYLVPLWATLLGVVVLDEQLTMSIVLAFIVIFAGLLLSHDGGFSSPRTPC